jgi:hypothetical protein
MLPRHVVDVDCVGIDSLNIFVLSVRACRCVHVRTPAHGNCSKRYQKYCSEYRFMVPVGNITMRRSSYASTVLLLQYRTAWASTGLDGMLLLQVTTVAVYARDYYANTIILNSSFPFGDRTDRREEGKKKDNQQRTEQKACSLSAQLGGTEEKRGRRRTINRERSRRHVLCRHNWGGNYLSPACARNS